MGVVIGIDLGYSSSRAGYVDENGMLRILPNAEGALSTPSVVYFDADGSVMIGREAMEMSRLDPMRLIRFCKNYFGDPVYTAVVDDREYSMKDIASLLLQKIVADAEDLLGADIDGAVLSCPSYWNEQAKKDMIDAAQAVVLSSGERLRVLDALSDEHAIAVAYGNACHVDENKNILVYDLGGGSFRCAVVTVSGGDPLCEARTVAVGGDHCMLGAVDWERALINYIAERFCDLSGEDLHEVKNDPDMSFCLWRAADFVKNKLSRAATACAYLSYGGKRVRVDVTREIFEELTEEYLSTTVRLINEMLERAAISVAEDIDTLVLAGGGVRMPQVSKRLQREYQKPIAACGMELAVVHGLALGGKNMK